MKIHKIPFRLIFSVIAGLASSMFASVLTHEILHLSGLFPPLFKPMFDTRLTLISLLYHSFYAIGGAYITAMVAREKAKKAVLILGSKEAIMWLLGTLLLWKHSPVWFNITKALIGIPLALIGGKLYDRTRKKQNKAPQIPYIFRSFPRNSKDLNSSGQRGV